MLEHTTPSPQTYEIALLGVGVVSNEGLECVQLPGKCWRSTQMNQMDDIIYYAFQTIFLVLIGSDLNIFISGSVWRLN